MEHLTRAIFESVIERLSGVFDSHAFIFAVMTSHSHEYVREEYARIGHADPIQSTSAAIGAALGNFQDLIEPFGRVVSRNVRGNENENQQWRKLTSSTDSGGK